MRSFVVVLLVIIAISVTLLTSCSSEPSPKCPGKVTRITNDMELSVFVVEFEGHRYLASYHGGIIEIH
jgi:hypothetical protein